MNDSLKILLLEDNPSDAKLVHRHVSKSISELQWLHVSELDAFVEALSNFNPDLILSDYNLGGFTGLDALDVVRKECPLVPFIIVTGTLSDEIAAETIKKGAWDYVVKDRIGRLDIAIINTVKLSKERREKEKAAENLSLSNELQKTLLQTIPFGIDIIDEEGNILFLNENLLKHFGADAIGKKCWTLYRDDKLQCDDCPLKAGISLGKTDIYESQGVFGAKIFEISHTGMIFQGKKALLEVFQDITERKQSENELIISKNKAEESDKLKTAFLHNISHEIRTPLNAIVGFSSLLRKPDLLPEKTNYFVDLITQSSDHLLAIMSDIVSISTIEAGQEKVNEVETNINSICRLISDQFTNKAKAKNILLSYKTSLTDDDANIISDATKLTQILTNLLGNAIKFTHQGSIKLEYTLKGTYLEFYVEDSGIGIPQDLQEAIFDRFRQVETDTTRNYDGSGLGLSISKAFVEMLGGRMWLTSELNRGTVFYFTIPYKKVIPNVLPDIPPVNGLNSDIKKPITLLIAEDEDSSFKLLEELLEESELKIIRAKNGNEAIALCRANPDIDLVLMDIKMPFMDGYHATAQIKKLKPDLPIIAQTAYSTESDKNKALACGCSDFISKPINIELLRAKINEQLHKLA